MNPSDLREIASRCADLQDGQFNLTLSTRKIPVDIVLVKCDGLSRTSLRHSLFSAESSESDGQQTSEQDPDGVDDVGLLKKAAEKLGVSWVWVGPNMNVVVHEANDSDGLYHVRKPVCFLETEGLVRIIYHGHDNLVPLYTYTLHAFQNVQTDSAAFNLLIFQLVEMYNAYTKRGIYPLFSLHMINVDPSLWLMSSLDSVLTSKYLSGYDVVSEQSRRLMSYESSPRLWEATGSWQQKRMSNFDYLMLLNKFAGRTPGDPHNHPIFPWVVDFSRKEGGWRRLDRTKYRVQKGDDQLVEQFKRQPAHHIPELLSELSYMIYRARVESKENLCRYVRSQWLPAAYPSSMQRLFETTPDECIPEFYADPTIFKSTHPDLPDLQLPDWTETPEQFIEWHRNALESDQVSAKLHQWIDLVFGYLLSGSAAVEALNVHLCFVRKSTLSRTTGAVQLFTRPHPRRLPNPEPLTMPDQLQLDYSLDRSLQLANNPSQDCSFSLSEALCKNGVETYAVESAASVAVTLVELCVPEYCRDLSPDATFEDRLNRARIQVRNRANRIPRHILKGVSLLLGIAEDETDPVELQHFYLTSTLMNLFHLPATVIPVHRQLCVYHGFSGPIEEAFLNDDEATALDLYLVRVQILWNCASCTDFSGLWKELFVNLLQNLRFSVTVCKQLFARITEFLSPEEIQDLVKPVAKLFEYNIPDLPKLFDRRFLLQLSMRFGTKEFLESFLPKVIEALISLNDNLQAVARESVLWMSKRYGPILTVKYFTSNILRLLALCFSEPHHLEPEVEEMSLDVRVAGDALCAVVVQSLVELAVLYGPALVTLHYLPYCADLAAQGLRRMTPATESALISAMALCLAGCELLTDRQLMDQLDELLVERLLLPVARLVASPNVAFASGRGRRLFACKAVRALHLLACRLGGENVKRHLRAVLQRLFAAFSMLYDAEPAHDGRPTRFRPGHNSPSQLMDTFCPSFARLLLKSFSSVCGRKYLIDLVPDAELVTQLASDQAIDCSPLERLNLVLGGTASPALSKSPSLSASLGNSGNRLLIQEQEDEHDVLPSSFDPNSNEALHSMMSPEDPPHLSENWVDRVRAVLSATTDDLIFDQIGLVTYTGHSAAVRQIRALDNENSFLTGSQDRTVKLWSIKTSEEASQCQWTYQHHTRPVQDLVFMPMASLVVSADQAAHVWDPFRGSVVHRLHWPSAQTDASIVGLAPTGSFAVAVAADNEQVIRTLDLRMGCWCCHALVGVNQAQSHAVRAMSVSPSGHKLAVALSNGSISLMDTRTGKLLAVSFQQHTDITKLEWFDEQHFASLYTDHGVTVWQTGCGLRTAFRLADVAALLVRHADDQFLTVHGGRMRFYRRERCLSDVRLRSDFVSGALSVLTPLPLNNMFLAGSTSGMVRLAC